MRRRPVRPCASAPCPHDGLGPSFRPEHALTGESPRPAAMRAEACEEDERAAMTRRSEVAGPREVVEAGVLGSLVAQEPRKARPR